jgi:hypothetical protein
VNTILRLLLPLLGGIVGRALASLFSGSCPLDASGFVCVHWEAIASAAGVVLGALGYRVTRPKLEASRAAIRRRLETPSLPKPRIDLAPKPSVWGENVGQGISDDDRPPG